MSSSVFLRTMTFQPLAIADIMKAAGRGSDNLNSTVYLSRALISLTVLNSMLRGMLMPDGGLATGSQSMHRLFLGVSLAFLAAPSS